MFYPKLFYQSDLRRLGLLGPSLGLHPTGGLLDENNKSMDAADGDVQDKSEALVAISDPFSSSQCCCFNKNETCPDPFGLLFVNSL